MSLDSPRFTCGNCGADFENALTDASDTARCPDCASEDVVDHSPQTDAAAADREKDSALEAVCHAALSYAGEAEGRSHSDDVIAAGDRIRAAVALVRGQAPAHGWAFAEYEREAAVLGLCDEHGAEPDDDGEKRGRWAVVMEQIEDTGRGRRVVTFDVFSALCEFVADEFREGWEANPLRAFDLDQAITDAGRPSVALALNVTVSPDHTPA